MRVFVVDNRLGDTEVRGIQVTFRVAVETSGSSRGSKFAPESWVAFPGSNATSATQLNMSCMFDSHHGDGSSKSVQQHAAGTGDLCTPAASSAWSRAALPILPPQSKQGPNDNDASCTEIMGETSSPSVRRCFGHRPDLICAKARCRMSPRGCACGRELGDYFGDKLSDRFGAGH